MIGGFLVLNMIVGVVVENFQKCQELQQNRELETNELALTRWRLRLITGIYLQ